MELSICNTKYDDNELKLKVDCDDELRKIDRIDLLEYNGNIIKTFTHVNIKSGHTILVISNMLKGSYLLRIRDSKFADILKLEI